MWKRQASQSPPTPTEPEPPRSWGRRAAWWVMLGIAGMVGLVILAAILRALGNWLVLVVAVGAVVVLVRRRKVEDVIQRWRGK